jgi:signal transduction histidine kinase
VAVVRGEVERRNALARSLGRPAVEMSPIGEARVALSPAVVGQLVGNVLDNATRHGAPPVSVTVDRVGALGRLLVVDAGPGMDPGLLATATRRFTRSAASRSREGFGLGLSLVESIVVGSGGQLRLCFAGHHERHGALPEDEPGPPCTHPDAMTVTVLLPLSDSPTGSTPGGDRA